jgi:hypothetical protein
MSSLRVIALALLLGLAGPTLDEAHSLEGCNAQDREAKEHAEWEQRQQRILNNLNNRSEVSTPPANAEVSNTEEPLIFQGFDQRETVPEPPPNTITTCATGHA